MKPTPEEINEFLPVLLKSGSPNGRLDIQKWFVKNSDWVSESIICALYQKTPSLYPHPLAKEKK